MNTSDWAEEAHAWFTSYHEAIISESFDPDCFFFGFHVDDSLWETIQTHTLLREVNLENWQSHPFDLLEQVRGWQPLLRRLSPAPPDSRLLTLMRRDLHKNLDNASNQTLVSRHQWTLMEALRWRAGLYDREDVLNVLKESFHGVASPEVQVTESDVNPQSLKIIGSSDDTNGRGRHVVWSGAEPAIPGDILWEAQPFCVAPYDFSPVHRACCFHCGRSAPPSANMVRDLTLQCVECQVWSYCGVQCKKQSQRLHQHECGYVAKLLDRATELRMARFKALLVYRTVLKRDLVGEDDESWKQLLQLQHHSAQYAMHDPAYLHQAQAMSQWMLDQGLVKTIRAEMLSQLFLAININAIGLGSFACGLFPGMPSMFNHSCNENVTHGWDLDGMLRFRAVESIDYGQECFISYVSNLELPTAQRTESLSKYKFFTCYCDRCQSPDEQGRAEAIRDWKKCVERLEGGPSFADSITLYRRLVEVSEILFPAYFVTKGWALEECAHALQQDLRLKDESVEMLQGALRQYEICRGRHSPLVQRVEKALTELTPASPTSEAPYNQLEDDNDDLILVSGWSRALLEIKTYEPDECILVSLGNQIKAHWNDTDVVRWNDGYQLYDIGYGIQSLVLSCQVNESVVEKETVVDETQEAFDEDVQNVDIISA